MTLNFDLYNVKKY